MVDAVASDYDERKSLCIAGPQPGAIIHSDDQRFPDTLSALYDVHESNAIEELVRLKRRLHHASTDDFWTLATEGFASIAGAQYGFVSKRILVDDENSAVEMPPIGETGSCLMASAMYYNDGRGTKSVLKNYKYHAYGCPCAYMRHDKVFIIPGQLPDFITDNPNQLPDPGEAYLGIPLSSPEESGTDGKCFGHFGIMWSREGAEKRKLGWGFLEMLMHSLEDIITARVLKGQSFKPRDDKVVDAAKVIPHGAITSAQSLKPYARSLSHELRTPLQGVVGMLDVMMATVQEAAEGQSNAYLRNILKTLRENIEVVQGELGRSKGKHGH